MKERIIKITDGNGKEKYVPQWKFLWWHNYYGGMDSHIKAEFTSLAACEKWLRPPPEKMEIEKIF